jgi:hypothetical protein
MMPESRINSLLDNGSLGTYPQQLISLWGNQTFVTKLTHVSAAKDKHRAIDELLKMVISVRFSRSYEREDT